MVERWKAYGTALAVFLLDRATKWIVETRVSFLDTHKIIPGFFDIVPSDNRGVAFGIFNDSTSEWRTTLLVLASVIAVTFVSVMLWRADRLDRYSFWGLSLILGGAAGNVFAFHGASEGFVFHLLLNSCDFDIHD